jgi:hypothetical protein
MKNDPIITKSPCHPLTLSPRHDRRVVMASWFRPAAFAICACASVLLVACESEFATDPSRPRPTRAVASPTEYNSSEGEVLNPQPNTLPLVQVDLSNTKNESPKIHTIVDTISESQTPAATQPAAQPATLPGPTRVDPIFGPAGH